jgi:hypothetical protein
VQDQLAAAHPASPDAARAIITHRSRTHSGLKALRVRSPAHAAIGRRKFQRVVALLYVLRHRQRSHWSWETLQRAAQPGQVRQPK